MLERVPEEAEVHIALSETMRELGLTAEIDDSGRYDSVRRKLNALDRETQDRERRKLGAAPDYILGSAAAITDDGEIVVGSGSGSRRGAVPTPPANSDADDGGHQKLSTVLADGGSRRGPRIHLLREHYAMQAAGICRNPPSDARLHREAPCSAVILVPETLRILSPNRRPPHEIHRGVGPRAGRATATLEVRDAVELVYERSGGVDRRS